VKRVEHESNQMALKLKEKENEYRMLNLKIKELKRTIQGTYVHKATQDNRKSRKKSAKSMTKKTPPKKEPQMRPNSSKRAGLEEAIKQEREIDNKEFETPIEANISRGVDFNGGMDDDYDMDYEDDIDRTMEQSPKQGKRAIPPVGVSDKLTQEETFRNQNKEIYSKKANESMKKENKSDNKPGKNLENFRCGQCVQAKLWDQEQAGKQDEDGFKA
jgi:hypothetical protein